jgi:hypothetical protein
MRSKRPGWAAAGRRSSLISALSGRRRFPVDFDELDEIFDAEVGERHDAVVAEPLEHPAAGQRRAGVQQIDKDLRRADVGVEGISLEGRAEDDGPARPCRRGRASDRRQRQRARRGRSGRPKKVEINPMHLDMHRALRCHAKSKRSGLPCRAEVCRMHGAGGWARKGNKNAVKRGAMIAESLVLRREIQALARMARKTIAAIG